MCGTTTNQTISQMFLPLLTIFNQSTRFIHPDIFRFTFEHVEVMIIINYHTQNIWWRRSNLAINIPLSPTELFPNRKGPYVGHDMGNGRIFEDIAGTQYIYVNMS